MATVTNTVKLPDGSTPDRVDVVIELVASTTGRAAGWITATDVTLEATVRPTVTNGAWTASLTPNADITPSGSVYKVTEYVDKTRYTHYIEVGSGGGSLFDLLVDAPATVESSALGAHKADTTDAHDASAISVLDTAGRFAGSDVETVLAELSRVWRVDADPTGVTDARAAIQTAIDAASAAGGGTVYIPEGTYKVVTAVAGTVSIVPKSKVRILGAGVGRTILMAYGNAQCFYNNTASSGSPIIDVEIGHLEIDGTNQSNGGVYVSSMKGIQINYCKRHYYHDLYVHHCGATGVGSDYLYDSTYERIIADYNGRLASTSDAGGSGIGIGTGVYTVENLVVRDCVTRNNGVHGVFWENQGGVESTGMSLVNHYTANNGVHGIGECGVDRLRVLGGQTRANGSAGFGSYKGTYSGASGPGKNIHIVGLEALGNTGHGFLFDATDDGIDGVYLEGVLSIGNGLNGVVLSNGSDTCTGFKVLNSHIENNQRSGLRVVTTGGGITDVVISGCQFVANGRDSGAGTDRAGISIANSVTQLRIVNNRCWDSQSSKTQTYGLHCGTVTLTGGEINDNDFAQNLTGGALVSNVTWSSFRVGRNNAWTISTGTPESAVAAPVGTLFYRLDGGAGATLYVKETGSSTTGWAAK